jgi:hypothetical protein
LSHEPDRIGTEEQIAEGAAQQISDPPVCQMVWAIMDHVAALDTSVAIMPPAERATRSVP